MIGMYGPPGYLRNPHAIAVTVKAVPGIDGVAIRSENEFAPRERADENEQRGLRQMEIRQQLIDHAKRVPRLDANSRFRWAGLDKKFRRVPPFAVPGGRLRRGIFECAHHG